MTEERRIAVLLGAGFAVDAHLPDSVGLKNRLKSALLEGVNPSSQEQRSGRTKELLSTFYLLNGALRFQEGFLNRDPESEINVEQMAGAALELSARMENPVTPFSAGWHHRLTELESNYPKILQEFVDVIYESLTEWLQFGDAEDVQYMAHLSSLLGHAPGIDVFSLNYDLCVESALVEAGHSDFVNGFGVSGWDPSLLDEARAIRIFKLHGSLDWVDDEAYGLCSLEFPRHRDGEDIDESRPPLLIFGTHNKIVATQPFVTLMYHFSRALSSTSLLLIIGYGFGDLYINGMIKQVLRANTNLRVLVVNPRDFSGVPTARFLERDPKVSWLHKDAKSALESGDVDAEVVRLLESRRESTPF